MKTVLKILLPLLIVVLAIGGAVAMKKLRPRTERRAPPPRTAMVDVLEVQIGEARALIRGTGVVEAARTVTLSPEVAGRVTWQADELVPGGRLKKGEIALRIDDRDYQLGLKSERARLRQAQLELQIEASRQGLAQKEFDLLGGGDPETSALALRKPQLETVQASLEGAEASVARAELSLERTRIVAPFNAMVMDEKVEVGQLAGPNSVLATLIGTDQFWVRVSVPVEQLSMLEVPGLGANVGSTATITQELGPRQKLVRQGVVLRLLGQLDPETRTAQVLVGIDDPLISPDGAPPILPGAYVSVLFEGKPIEAAFRVPREAFSDGDRLWLVDEANSLRRRQVTVGWRGSEDLFVVEGLSAGERVVVSPLSLPVDGLPVRLLGEPSPKELAETGEPDADPS